MACTAALKKLKSVSTIVFVDTKTNGWKKLPESVQSALTNKKLGTYIPKTLIMSPDLTKSIAHVRYEEWKSSSKVIKKVKEAIKKNASDIKGEEKEPSEDIAKNKDKESKKLPNPKLYSWSNSKGTKTQAWFVKLSGETVVLKSKTGKLVNFPLSKLSTESQTLAKSLGEELNN